MSILINGKPIPIKITPRELQLEFDKTHSRKGQKEKCNTFRTNPLKMIGFLCKIYQVDYKLTKPTGNKVKYTALNIPAMNIHIGAIGTSNRNAKLNLVYKLHHA